MLFPCGIYLVDSGCYSNSLLDDVASLQIWEMFLFGPSPHVIDFDDVSSQYEGKYIVQ